MLSRPNHIIEFGINNGFTLAEIFKYQPSYIEVFLIKYDGAGLFPDFQIDVNEFYALGNPTPIDNIRYPSPEAKLENGLTFSKRPEFSVRGALRYIKEIGHIPPKKFQFSQETLNILELKKMGKYDPPDYNTSI